MRPSPLANVPAVQLLHSGLPNSATMSTSPVLSLDYIPRVTSENSIPFLTAIPSSYLMTHIACDTSTADIIRSLAGPDTQFNYKLILGMLDHEPVLLDSKLDDSLSVTTVEFKDTPKWLRDLNNDPCGFPKTTQFGTLWRGGVDMAATDQDLRTAFMRAVIDANVKYAETLAEFETTDVNAQDITRRTALREGVSRAG